MADGKSTGGVVAIVVIIIVVIAVVFGFLRVRQTQDAKLPQVSVAGGQAPKFDVDAAKVDERAEVGDVLHRAGADLARLDVGQ